MVASLAHRGPDGYGVLHDGPGGLGHRALWTTPESREEKLPRERATGDLAITVDARIDNRGSLRATLSISGRPSDEANDSDLILAAYAKWGERCPEYLLGDFAFAIWDRRRQVLFCARDHFGVKPFCYYHSRGRIFAFASEVKALLCLSQVPRSLNEVKIGDHLTSSFDDTSSTFYRDIFRLPAGHCMAVTAEGVQLRQYWSPDPSRELQRASDAEYAEEFREIFTEAVRCRLRSAYPVGSLLSGGLDSSAITCVAREPLIESGGHLATFSAVFDDVSECDERPYINAVLAMGGMDSTFVHGDESSPLVDHDRMLFHQDEPLHAFNLFLNWSLYNAARERGIRVLLDGFDGDTTVSHGYGFLEELASAGRWFTLAREVRGYAKNFGFSPWRIMRGYLSRSLPLRVAARISRKMRRERNRPQGRPRWTAMLNPDFVRRTGLVERRRAFGRPSPRTERQQHHQLVTSGVMAYTLEVLDRAAAAFAIEPRYPFWDKRLVEYCLALPPEQKIRRGWTRFILRRGLSGILPVEVQWRRDKSNMGPNFEHTLRVFERERLDDLLVKSPGAIEEFVDLEAVQASYREFLSNPPSDMSQHTMAVWKAATLALWLRQARIDR